MATIVGAITTSHVPAIGGAIAKKLHQDPYWQPFFAGYPPAREWLAKARPDVVVAFYNDHGLQFFLDKMPTFAVGAAPEYRHADEGWGIPTVAPFRGDPELSWHVIERLIAEEFDLTTCQEMLVDHAFTVPMSLLWPDVDAWPVRVVPIAINTVQYPFPSPARCFRLGQAVGRALEAWDRDVRVLVLGTGGLSHQLDGERAGFINKAFDQMCMEKLVAEPEALTRYSTVDIIREAGVQGVEFVMWLAARGALTGTVARVHASYHIPISNTAAGLLVMENRPRGAAESRAAA
ncbi:MAG: class III extradiol dioxygenase family protein [Burkholderiales bacterium]|nr:class III extradiol dioxygenase family protein [Burkholderiales bacterium]